MGIDFNLNGCSTDVLKQNNAKNYSTDFKEEALSDINKTADDAYNQMLKKKAEYEAAKGIFTNFAEKKATAYKKYQSAQLNSKNGYTSLLSESKNSYDSVLSQFNDAEINVDVLRSSLTDSIFYSGKMNNTASVANSVLG